MAAAAASSKATPSSKASTPFKSRFVFRSSIRPKPVLVPTKAPRSLMDVAKQPDLDVFFEGSTPVKTIAPLEDVALDADSLMTSAYYAVEIKNLAVLKTLLDVPEFDPSINDNALLVHCAECNSVAAFEKVMAHPKVIASAFGADGSVLRRLFAVPNPAFFRMACVQWDSLIIDKRVSKMVDAHEFALEFLQSTLPSRFSKSIQLFAPELLFSVVCELLTHDSFFEIGRGLQRDGSTVFEEANVDIALFFSMFVDVGTSLDTHLDNVKRLLAKGAAPEFMGGMTLAAAIRCLPKLGRERSMDISVLRTLLTNIKRTDCDYYNMIRAAHATKEPVRKSLVKLVNKLVGIE